MSEQSATSSVVSNARAAGFHAQRFEDKFAAGLPDLNISRDGVEFWLEGKFLADLPKRDATPVRFGKAMEPRLVAQAQWLGDRAAVGGRAYVWVRVAAGSADAGWWLFNPYPKPRAELRSAFDWLFEGMSTLAFRGRLVRYASSVQLVETFDQIVKRQLGVK